MAKKTSSASTSKYAIPIEPEVLATLNEFLEKKKWTRDTLLMKMLAHFFGWYDSESRHADWQPVATPKSDSKLYAAYLEEAQEYRDRVEQELMREYLVAESAILYNVVRRYVRDHFSELSTRSETAATVVVYLPSELDSIIRLMKGMKHFGTYNEFYEAAAEHWFSERRERVLAATARGVEEEPYRYIEPVTAALLTKFEEKKDAYQKRALTFSRQTYNRIATMASIDEVNINNVGLHIILDYMEHLEQEGELELFKTILEAQNRKKGA